MAMTTRLTTFHWPKPEDIDLQSITFSYDPLVDVLELSFDQEPVPRVEVPLETSAKFTPLASVRENSRGELTGEVVGIMVDNLSQAFARYPAWQMLTKGTVDRAVLASLIEAFSALPEESDVD